LQTLDGRPESRPGQRASLCVVVPMLNEEKGLPHLLERLTLALDVTGLDWQVLFVDDGSTDRTLEVIRTHHDADPRIRAISLSRNFGKEVAVAAGLANADADAVVIMDADLQHPPEKIAEFVALWQQGYDIVYGQRIDRSADSPLRRLFARSFYKVFYTLSGTELPEGAGDFRLLSRRAVTAFNRMGERARFNKGLYTWIGFRSIGVPFVVPSQFERPSRWQARKLWHFAIDGVASFSTVPLRIWSYLGLLVSLFAIASAAYFLVKTLMFGSDLPGFPTVIVSIMLLSGVQLICLGVIGEYLGRIYDEVKARPLYLVADTVGVSEVVLQGERRARRLSPSDREDLRPPPERGSDAA
jgi:glycosyltransferase involved in cell wall biosynthesis